VRRIHVNVATAVIAVGASIGLITAIPAHAASSVNYVALGDSYSSGVGAGNYISSSGGCDRSTNAYPEQWDNVNAPASFVSVACSGATMADVRTSQVSALSRGTTLVSLTIGGNDAGFSHVMEICVLESTNSCLSAVAAAKSFVAGPLPGLLNSTLQTIRARAPAAKIVLHDLSKSSGCIGLSTADRTALNQAADQLDGAMATAARANNDTFADVRAQFTGHELCDSGSWLNSVDIFDISASYHPKASGQILGYLPVFTAAAR
jgi:lysophospholipase L1-like esterase